MKPKKKTAKAPARGAASSKKAVQTVEAKARANAKTPAEARAAAAGNLPANSPEARSLASKVPPPPLPKMRTGNDLLIDLGNAQMRVLRKKSELQDAEEALKSAKKKRDGLVAERDELVDELLDIAGDIRAGQGRLDLQVPPSTPAAPATAAKPAPSVTPSAVTTTPKPTEPAKPAATPVEPSKPTPTTDAPKAVDPKAEKKDAHAA